MDCSTPGLPVHHQHWVSDAIEPSHPLSSPSLPAFSLSQHLCLFKWVSSSHQVAKVWEFQLQHQFLPINIQDWFPLGWTGWISLLSKGLSWVFPTPQFKSINSLVLSFLYSQQLSHPYMTTGKTIALTRRSLVGKVMSLLFNMLSMLVITFLPRSKRLLISWMQSPSAVILEPSKIKSHCFQCFSIYLPWSDGTNCHDFNFLNVEF